MHLTQISGLDLKGIHLATSGSRADRRNPFFASDLQGSGTWPMHDQWRQ